MESVLITGGTGMIGTALSQALTAKGYKVIVLTRNRSFPKDGPGKITYAAWDVENGIIDERAIRGTDYVIHLAGANVGDKRWTQNRKKEIVDSRVRSGLLLVKSLRDIPNKVKAVISASGIGWYGPDKIPVGKPFVETDPPSDDFLGSTCSKWEGSIEPVSELGKRLVILRTGIVLSNKGGAYPEFKKPMRFGMAPILGNGRQIISWIHIVDIVRIYMEAMENERWNGIYNAVAPQPVSNRNLILEIAGQRKKFYVVAPIRGFILEMMLGQMSVEVLKSTTVSSQKIENEGFMFFFPSIQTAIRQLEHR